MQHHFPQVFQGLLLPGLVPDVLPARQLRKHQQAQPVTFIDKMLALGIVRGAHRVALQLLLQNPGVLPLQALRGGIADIGIALVPVQAPEEGFLPVEIEAVRLEFRRPVAEAHFLPVQHRPALQQFCPQGVQLGRFRRPGLGLRIGDSLLHAAHRLHQQLLSVQHGKADGIVCTADLYLGHQRVGCRGGDEHIRNVALLPHVQPGLPVQSAVGQIVNDEAEGRDGRVFRRVQLHRQVNLPAKAGIVRDLQPEGGVAAAVAPHVDAIDVHIGPMGRAVKLQKQPFPPVALRDGQLPPVAANHLVVLRPGIMQGQLFHVVGQPHRLPRRGSFEKGLAPFRRKFPIVAKADHGKPLRFLCPVYGKTALP